MSAVGDLAASKRLNLAIGLPLRNQASLSAFLNKLYDPASSDYHRYLTPQQFAEQFGPTEQDYQALLDFAKANGLRVTARHPNHLLLDVNASIEEIERAFHVKMRLYRHPTEDRAFYAPDAEPSLDFTQPVLFIGGLDNYVLPQPMHRPASPSHPTPNLGSGPGGSYMGVDFRSAYAPGVPLTGAGQTVALVQFDGFYPGDITAYENLAGLPNVPLETVLLGGYDGIPVVPEGNAEVSLDIEMVISMAPGISKIVLYEAGPNGLAEDILSRIANDNIARQISSSWTWTSYDPNSEAIFQQFAVQGQTYFNATGDRDAFVGPITQAPSDDPYIVQVGGTALAMNGAGQSYLSETVWNRGGGIGSSGGISTTYAIPPWQQAISMSACGGSTTMRNIPDVAMVADDVYVIYGSGATGSFGGTSCAAPLWAGFTALMNQQAVTAGRSPVGFINPALYRLGTNGTYALCFHDITIGSNTWSGSPGNFYAVPGYDLCTGWGTPAGSNLIDAIAGPPLSGPLIVASNLSLLAETCPNNVLDPGETVVVRFGLRNIGVAPASNLVATLQASGGIVSPSGPPVVYGTLPAGGGVVFGDFAFSASGNCGGTNLATLRLQDGPADLGAVSFPILLGQFSSSIILTQNFDSVISPALPTGWTTSSVGAGASWATTSALSDSPPNSAFVPDPPAPSDKSLISPSLLVPGPAARLSFRHNFYTETGYDGGALEIAIAAGPFMDIITAGGAFVTNGYTQNISACCGNPLANRGAWTGSSSSFITTIVTLPAAAAGRNVRLRWRFCSDTSVGATGWYIDNISVIEGFSCCAANHPLIQSIIQSNGFASVTWLSAPGRTYRLQSNTNLSTSDWNDVPGDIVANESTSTKSDPITTPQKVYRVILLP